MVNPTGARWTRGRLEAMRLYFIGAVGGALSTTAVLLIVQGLLNPISTERTAFVVLIPLAAMGLLRDLFPDSRAASWWPDPKRQVTQDAAEARAGYGMLQFGFEMGTGVRTYMTAASPLLLAVAIALGLATIPETLVAGLAFGILRGLVPIRQAMASNPQAFLERLNGMPIQRWLPVSTTTVFGISLVMLAPPNIL